MIDCGEDWFNTFEKLQPHAIVITHAHPDHAFGLKAGAPCPVYATQKTWEKMKRFPVERASRRVLAARRPEKIAGIIFEPFPVVHSTRAPAVGYRIQAGATAIFYVPDVVRILGRSQALKNVQVYIGDGATLSRPIIRKEKQTHQLIGHTTIRDQLVWCKTEGIRSAVFTHCGSGIVKGDADSIRERLRQWAERYNLTIEIAYDGMELIV